MLVLEFHDIFPSPRLGINTIHPDHFRKIISVLVESHQFSPETCLITFDDAYQSIIDYAFPILEKFGLTGMVFIITGYIGKKNSWDPSPLSSIVEHCSLQDLLFLRNQGWIMASHGHFHLTYTKINASYFPMDFHLSQQWFQENFQSNITHFGLPFNQIDANGIRFFKDDIRQNVALYGGLFPPQTVIARIPVYSFMKPHQLLKIIRDWPRRQSWISLLAGTLQQCAKVSAFWQNTMVRYPEQMFKKLKNTQPIEV